MQIAGSGEKITLKLIGHRHEEASETISEKYLKGIKNKNFPENWEDVEEISEG